MIGRVYTLGGQFWRVLARGAPFDKGPRRNVLVERVAPWMGVGWGDHWFQDEQGRWWRPDGPDRMVRPFRGLTRA